MLKVLLICSTLFVAANLSDVSFYETLGVSKQASSQEIRQAYKKLAVKFHPDKNPEVTLQEKFLKITEAYETLKDADKRRKYDLYGSYPSYSRKYDHKSQAEYDNMFYNGLYHNDPNVETLSGKQFYNYLNDGFYFINFYSPFCPPCQNVADHWKKLAEMYKGIVKVGAVNCKYHNSFCYNSMRIGSYPTLLFYPDGKHGSYVYYQGERTLEGLDSFVMTYLRSKVHVPTVTRLRGMERPVAYVMGRNRVDGNALTRIAYQLNGLVTIAVVEDDDIRQQLTNDDSTTVVFRYKQTIKQIEGTDEEQLLKDIVELLPKIELINPDKLKNIRNKLRRGSEEPWVLYFSTKSHDKLELHQMRISRPDLQFGEIDCDTWRELCTLLQVETPPGWGVLKRGGAYQLVQKHSIDSATEADNLHTLSASELTKILDAGEGLWVLLVVPHGASWSHILAPFTQASLHFLANNYNFGITACSGTTDHYCRRVARNEPTIIVQNGTKLTHYSGEFDANTIVEFLQLLKDSAGMELSESQVLHILDASSRAHTWLVAHLPPHCGRFCQQLAQEWMKVFAKLRPLEFVRVGVLNCAHSSGGFCSNIRAATARLYPLASGSHYSVNLQQVTEAPYILEWALERIDDSVQKLNWHSFTKTVIAEELNPSSTVKPWLVYFHSPRCYKCYEMYADFAIAGILLNNAVNLGKVNCLADRGLCQHEHITSYPSLKLYLNRNHVQRFSSVVSIQVRSYEHMLGEIKPYLNRYNVDRIGVQAKHDEF